MRLARELREKRFWNIEFLTCTKTCGTNVWRESFGDQGSWMMPFIFTFKILQIYWWLGGCIIPSQLCAQDGDITASGLSNLLMFKSIFGGKLVIQSYMVTTLLIASYCYLIRIFRKTGEVTDGYSNVQIGNDWDVADLQSSWGCYWLSHLPHPLPRQSWLFGVFLTNFFWLPWYLCRNLLNLTGGLELLTSYCFTFSKFFVLQSEYSGLPRMPVATSTASPC